MSSDARVLCPVCRAAVADRDYWSHAIRHQSKPAVDTRAMPMPKDEDE